MTIEAGAASEGGALRCLRLGMGFIEAAVKSAAAGAVWVQPEFV